MNFIWVGVVAAMKSMAGTLSSVKKAGVPRSGESGFLFCVSKVKHFFDSSRYKTKTLQKSKQ